MVKAKWKLFDYLDENGRNIFKNWTLGLQKKERAKLNMRLDMLEEHGPELFPMLLSDTNISTIKKLRIHGSVALRPLLCRGPFQMQTEFTLLVGAIERDGELEPNERKAEEYRQILLTHPSRRCDHERVDGKTKG